MSAFVSPQLAQSAKALPAGPAWVFQEKYDGHRAQIAFSESRVTIYSRNGHDRTEVFESLVPDLSRLPAKSFVIDGELCVIGEDGRSDYGRLCAALSAGGPFHLKAFDLLELNGENLCAFPTRSRLNLLDRLLPSARKSLSVAETVSNGDALLAAVRADRREGVIAKRLDAPYRPGERSADWLKIKLSARQAFVIAGWHEDAHGRLQSLILGTMTGGRLQFHGCVGTGFSSEERHTMRERMLACRSARPVFERSGSIRADARWTVPGLVAEIEYAALSANGILRHPRFLGLRTDKAPADVVLTPAA
jgi:bifunctional non-homologous end joining protein LigD